MTCRTFRWKFNNSGETLDVGSERFSVNGSRSILKYTPITDQVSKKSNIKITTLTQSPGSKVDLKMQKPLSFYCSGLWNVIVLGLQWSGHTSSAMSFSSGVGRLVFEQIKFFMFAVNKQQRYEQIEMTNVDGAIVVQVFEINGDWHMSRSLQMSHSDACCLFA